MTGEDGTTSIRHLSGKGFFSYHRAGIPLSRSAMSILCPRCRSSNVYRDDRYRVTGTVVGGVGGAAAGFSGIGVGAAAGAAIGSVVPVLGSAIGAITGGLLGAVSGGISGAAIGHGAGHAMDNKHNRHLYRCRRMRQALRPVSVVCGSRQGARPAVCREPERRHFRRGHRPRRGPRHGQQTQQTSVPLPQMRQALRPVSVVCGPRQGARPAVCREP